MRGTIYEDDDYGEGPAKLVVRTPGCGCCSGTRDATLEDVDEKIADLKKELLDMKEFRRKWKGKIPERREERPES